MKHFGKRQRWFGSNGERRERAGGQFDLRKRMLLVAGFLGLGSVGLLARALDLQVVDHVFYQQQGDARFLREIPIATSRGMITDRNGEPLAISSPVESIWANPKELLKSPARLPALADALGMPQDELASRLSARVDKEFVYLKRRINPDEAARILALDIPGVASQREYRRFYPQGDVLAQVLGFTNIDDRGQEGLELAFDDWLRGTPGAKRVIRDNKGRIVENVDLVRAAQPGHDLALSIDRRIQYLTHRELRDAIAETGASSGSAVVLDVATGEVLAMDNFPTFNPNAVASSQRDAHRNRAVTDLMEPGSTMKPITVAAGLEAGVITPQTLFNTSPGWIPNGKYRTTDTHNYGVLDTTGIIRKSSNVGASLVAQRLSNEQFNNVLRRFGYGRSTGSGFPGEAAGLFPTPDRWSGTSKQTMSYGYGLSVTPLQIATAYAALGNGGLLHQPSFVKGQHNPPRQVLDPKIAREVLQMMQTVTEPGGTATQAAILGYHVAGKTGTSRKASAGGYSRRYIGYFAGLVPVDKPRFAMVVAVNDPDPSRKGYTGGVVAGPVFRNVMEGALRLMDVSPDDLGAWLAVQDAAEARRLKADGRAASSPVLPAPVLPAPVVVPASVHGGAP
ncbi:peptidoglycan D,D-transpeptidase FtsI family protein [Thermomonas paludicola]|uniref:peptidoglycan D,D-transpeptidase FtsI family protein n=1 Tax=Thermomonas paludicola TaxID=2884874 RepID=UPI003CCDA506